MTEVMYQLAFIQIMLKNISKDFNLKSDTRVNSDLCQINRPYFGRKIAFRLERDHAYLRLFWSLDETCPSGTNVF